MHLLLYLIIYNEPFGEFPLQVLQNLDWKLLVILVSLVIIPVSQRGPVQPRPHVHAPCTASHSAPL